MLIFFGGFFFSTKHSRRFASPQTHTWLTESEVLPCPYHLVMIGRGEEKDGLSFHYSANYYSRWRSESSTRFSHNPANVLGCHISSSQYIYIYIYIYTVTTIDEVLDIQEHRGDVYHCGTKEIFRARRHSTVVKSGRTLDSVKLLKGLLTSWQKVVAGRKKNRTETKTTASIRRK